MSVTATRNKLCSPGGSLQSADSARGAAVFGSMPCRSIPSAVPGAGRLCASILSGLMCGELTIAPSLADSGTLQVVARYR
jgi:hypothetical protein